MPILGEDQKNAYPLMQVERQRGFVESVRKQCKQRNTLDKALDQLAQEVRDQYYMNKRNLGASIYCAPQAVGISGAELFEIKYALARAHGTQDSTYLALRKTLEQKVEQALREKFNDKSGFSLSVTFGQYDFVYCVIGIQGVKRP